MRFAAVLAALLLVVPIGCASPIQLHYPASPDIYGKVIDRETKEPVEGALVSVKEYPSRKTTSLYNGYFELAGVERVFPQPVLGGALHLPAPSGTVIVEAAGYKTLETETLTGQWVSGLNLELERR